MKKIFIFAILMLCVGCDAALGKTTPETVPAPTSTPEVVQAGLEVVDDKTAYELHILTDYKLALYEPPDGCYIGGYILSNKKVDYDIENFEELVEKNHAFYSYNMTIGDKFPLNWILSCISNMKTPLITLRPGTDTFNEAALEKAAKELGEFYVPMFVQLYPVDRVYDRNEYLDYFRKARAIFKTHASNVALVWGAEGEFVYGAGEYYPGDEYVDWIGLSILQSVESEQQEQQEQQEPEVLKQLEYFYYRFQKNKPIMITGLGVSHFSSTDHVYRTSPAALVLMEIYGKIVKDYPRVKAVCYMDFNGVTIPTKRVIRENFSVTDDERKLAAYRQAISQEGYLSEINISNSGDQVKAPILSPFKAYRVGGSFYISAKSFEQDMNLSGVGSYANKKHIDGELYYNYDVIEKEKLGAVTVNRSSRDIYFEGKK